MIEKIVKITFWKPLVASCFFFIWALETPKAESKENVRVLVDGSLTVSADNSAGSSISLSYISSAVIAIDADTRFLRGVELAITAPQTYFAYRGSLAVAVYMDIGAVPPVGVTDIEAKTVLLEPLPNKIQTVYQLPIRSNHGLRATPYVTVPNLVIQPASFPILVRIMPIIKGISEAVENMTFTLTAKPVLSNEGALALTFRYPELLQNKPFVLLIDDMLIEKGNELQFLREGEHHLLILSEDFRNENRTFFIERTKILELAIDLQDPTPLIFFEAPERTVVYFDNELVDAAKPLAAEPGKHEIKMRLNDYMIIRPITVQKGKTYKISLLVDMNISEE
ncbi:MAG: hypothetical protein LBK73_03040 [Treponema sp.]|jgi:hypothetical protein|nr:hypothetical protein [Treponema sp.]